MLYSAGQVFILTGFLMSFADFLSIKIAYLTVQDIGTAAGLFVFLLIVFYVFRTVILIRLKSFADKTSGKLDDNLVRIVQDVPNFFYFLAALYFPLKMLVIHPTVLQVIDGVFMVLVVYQVIRSINLLAVFILNSYYHGREGEMMSTNMIYAIRLIINIGLWVLGLIMILSNLGVEVTSLIASLGIGGIAVALAVQNILGDVFSSFTIYFDKPFEIGDFIIVGKDMGVVKKIGIKSTRLTSLQGEEIVISNKELTSVRVQNFKKMEMRRIVFKFGVIYGTSVDKLKKAQEIVKNVISGIEDLRFDRCHFFEFGDFSLNYEVVYFVKTNDYNLYMDKQMAINLGVKEAFEKEGIEMAFPTQTVYLEKED